MSSRPPLKPDTLDFIFEHTKGAVDKQLADFDAIDAKASSVFTIASAVIGLAGIFAAFRTAASTTVTTAPGTTVTTGAHDPLAVTVLLFAAVFVYMVVAIATIRGWWLRPVQRADFAHTLWPEHWDDDVAPLKHMIVDAIPKILDYNGSVIRTKALSLTIALISAALEVVLVGVGVGMMAA